MMTTKIRGVLAPVVTPFHADGRVHFEHLLAQCHWLRRHGVGLAVLGTNSEANSLSLEERLQMLDFLVNEGIDPKAMMPGTGEIGRASCRESGGVVSAAVSA